MSLSVSQAAPTPPVPPSTASHHKTPESRSEPAPTPVSDTVHISRSALAAAKAAVQEATETATQTAQEARAGDPQAQRLVANHAAEHASRR